jgi:exodeoxyribonuclease V alpha subunit
MLNIAEFKVLKMYKDCPKPDGWFGCIANMTDTKLRFPQKVMVNGTSGHHLKSGSSFLGAYQIKSEAGKSDVYSIIGIFPNANTKDDIIKFFSGEDFDGIGEVTAEKIFKHLGRTAIKTLLLDPEEIEKIKGIGEKQKQAIKEYFYSIDITSSISATFPVLSGKKKLIEELIDTYGEKVILKLQQNPFEASFETSLTPSMADQIWSRSGGEPEDKIRVEGLIWLAAKETLLSFCNGDTYLDLSDSRNLHNWQQVAAKYLSGMDAAAIKESFKTLGKHEHVELKKIIKDGVSRGIVEFKRLTEAENFVAKTLANLKNSEPLTVYNEDEVNTFIDEWAEKTHSGKFSEEQRAAIHEAFKNRVSVITGGPGRGKTTVVACIAYIAQQYFNHPSILTSFTGKATGRIKEAIEEKGGYYVDKLYDETDPTDKEFFPYHAATMLSMTNKIRRGEEFLSESVYDNMLIIDELSMIDIVTLAKFFKVITDEDGIFNMQVVFVGDPDQLPAIGAGQILKDILKTSIKCSKLTTNFRAKDIPSLANNWDIVNEGDINKLLFVDNSFMWGAKTNDNTALVNQIESDYHDFIMEGIDPVDAEDIKYQVGFDPKKTIILAPTNAFVKEMNKLLQEKYNGDNKGKAIPTKTESGQKIYLYDRVMMTVNFNTEEFSYHTYDNGYYCVNGYGTRHDHLNKKNGKGIYNGDVGYVFDINYEDKYIGFETDDGRRFWLDPEKAQHLQLAYALTIHKSQGSEYKNILLALPPNLIYMGSFLSRNLVYTGITRAKQKIRLYGNEEALKLALENPDRIRNTRLVDLFSEHLAKSQGEKEETEEEQDDID